MPSVSSAPVPQNDSRMNRWPSTGSKSMPGARATPVAASTSYGHLSRDMESDAALTAGWCMLAATANPLEGPMLSDDAQTVYRAMMADPSLGVAGLYSRLNVTEDVVRGALDDLADASLLDLTRQDAAAAAHPWLTLSDVIAKEEAALLAPWMPSAPMR